MATQTQVQYLHQQLTLAIARRDEAIASCRHMEGLVDKLLAVTRQQGCQVERLMDIIESWGASLATAAGPPPTISGRCIDRRAICLGALPRRTEVDLTGGPHWRRRPPPNIVE
jgi:hypothetical protein